MRSNLAGNPAGGDLEDIEQRLDAPGLDGLRLHAGLVERLRQLERSGLVPGYFLLQ